MDQYLFQNAATGKRIVVKMGFAWDAFFFHWFFGWPLLRRGLYWDAVFGFFAFIIFISMFPAGTLGIIFGGGLYEGLTANRNQARLLYRKGWDLVGGETEANLIAIVKWKLERPQATPESKS